MEYETKEEAVKANAGGIMYVVELEDSREIGRNWEEGWYSYPDEAIEAARESFTALDRRFKNYEDYRINVLKVSVDEDGEWWDSEEIWDTWTDDGIRIIRLDKGNRITPQEVEDIHWRLTELLKAPDPNCITPDGTYSDEFFWNGSRIFVEFPAVLLEDGTMHYKKEISIWKM